MSCFLYLEWFKVTEFLSNSDDSGYPFCFYRAGSAVGKNKKIGADVATLQFSGEGGWEKLQGIARKKKINN